MSESFVIVQHEFDNTEGRRFFLLFRFYGPQNAAKDGSWELNDIERVK